MFHEKQFQDETVSRGTIIFVKWRIAVKNG